MGGGRHNRQGVGHDYENSSDQLDAGRAWLSLSRDRLRLAERSRSHSDAGGVRSVDYGTFTAGTICTASSIGRRILWNRTGGLQRTQLIGSRATTTAAVSSSASIRKVFATERGVRPRRAVFCRGPGDRSLREPVWKRVVRVGRPDSNPLSARDVRRLRKSITAAAGRLLPRRQAPVTGPQARRADIHHRTGARVPV